MKNLVRSEQLRPLVLNLEKENHGVKKCPSLYFLIEDLDLLFQNETTGEFLHVDQYSSIVTMSAPSSC